MPDGLYEQDFLIWSETQVTLLRRLSKGEQVDELVDWVNLIDEVGALGRSELNACESFLRQAMVYLLKLHRWPESLDCNHWRGKAFELLLGARKKSTPSMRQRLDLEDIYGDAVRRFVRQGGELTSVPATCPFLFEDLLNQDTDFTKLLNWSKP